MNARERSLETMSFNPNALHFFSSNELFGNIQATSMPVSQRVIRELIEEPLQFEKNSE